MTAMPASDHFALSLRRLSGAGYEQRAEKRFGDDTRRPDFRVLGLIAGFHVAALVAAVSTGTIELDLAPVPLETFSVAEPVKAAAPPEPEIVEIVVAELPPPSLVVAPPPIVRTPPRPSPVRAVSVTLPPEPVAVAVPVPAASATPAPPAPPAPVTPPDFSAAQLNNPAPKTPYLSRRYREEGTVMLRVLVTPEGTADTVELKTSSGFSRLDKAALKTVAKWRFVPARQAGEPVAAWVLVPVSFAAG
ncbi:MULTISPECIES: energy transducer TonB [Pacificimonas]|nr:MULTISPECIES: energy transducer TonB [Pacificimonas]